MNENLLNKIHCGHALDILKSFLDSFVDCVVTSPPYYGLRDYKIEPEIWGGDKSCAHEWRETIVKKMRGKAGVGKTGNHSQIIPGQDKEQKQGNFCSKCSAWRGSLGLEPNFNLYLDHLIQIFAEVKRVMKSTATLWVNLGDSYNSHTFGASKKGGGLQKKIVQENHAFPRWKKRIKYPDKCLCGVPERFAIRMTDELGMIRRNTIIWWKRNCMPSSTKDRFTVDFEPVYFFTKSPRYFFKQQFEPLAISTMPRMSRGINKNKWTDGADGQSPQNLFQPRLNLKKRKLEGTRYGGDGDGLHGHSGYFDKNGTPRFSEKGRNMRCLWDITTRAFSESHFAVFPEELPKRCIESGCPKGGLVLDPFAGAGTTCLVAKKLNRNYIGIEKNPEYVTMAERRIERECGTLV